jgi:hypothetical protein
MNNEARARYKESLKFYKLRTAMAKKYDMNKPPISSVCFYYKDMIGEYNSYRSYSVREWNKHFERDVQNFIKNGGKSK